MSPRDESGSGRVLTGPGETRGEACASLGLEPAVILREALGTFQAAFERHRGKAPDGEVGAFHAALGDLYLAGILVGVEVGPGGVR